MVGFIMQLFTGRSLKLLAYGALAVAITGAVWYFIDGIHFKPIRDAEAKVQEIKKEMKIKDALITKAGAEISNLNQTIYDLNQTLKDADAEAKIKLSECKEELNLIKWRINAKNIDTSDQYFYTKLPI